MTPEQFTEKLKAACGENLLASVLYGSAAAGDAIPGKSGFNVMAVLKTCGLEDLKAVAAASKDWIKKDNPPPLVFTREYLLSSADTFPIELADMKDYHKTLYGEDLLPGLNIDLADLRLALEREFKGQLVYLRHSYLQSGGGEKAVKNLMANTVSPLLVLCRAALRLHGTAVPASKLDCAVELAKHAQFDPSVFRAARELRSGDYKGKEAPEALFGRYLAAIEQLCAAVDKWSAAGK